MNHYLMCSFKYQKECKLAIPRKKGSLLFRMSELPALMSVGFYDDQSEIIIGGLKIWV